MIVTCTSCQARFRIPDEKIGSRGARVRCSKCKNVFVAKPAPDGAAVKVAPPPRDPFAVPPDDPFAASQAAQADPFAAAPGDPFAPPAPPRERTGGVDLPVTDLSDLAASGRLPVPAAPGRFTALAAPVPAVPAASLPAGTFDTGVASADDLVLEDPSRAIPVAPPPLPPAAPAFDFGVGGDLAEPAPGPEPAPGENPGGGVFEFGTPGTDLGEPAGAEPMAGLELGSPAVGAGGGDLAGADPFAAASSGIPLASGAVGAETAAPRAHTVTEPIPREPPPAPPTAAELRKAAGSLSAPPPRGRVQAFLASVVSLAALLAVAAGLLFWWLRDAVPDRAAGRPAEAVEVRSGLYETAAGRPVLFVRGQVLSRSPVPLGRVVVRAEVLQGGEVVARAEGLAGAVPSPEQVAQMGNRQDAARLRAQVASRAPARLAPGESLPFLITFDEVPEDVRDAVFRVAAEPQPGAPPRSP